MTDKKVVILPRYDTLLILRARTGEEMYIRKKSGFRIIHTSNGSAAKDGEPGRAGS